MLSEVLAAAAALRSAVADVQADQIPTDELPQLCEALASTEKMCAAVRLFAARQASKAGVPRRLGYKDAPAWLAHQSGVTPYQAKKDLAAARQLERCGHTKAALLSGAISVAQASEIARAEAEIPGVEKQLVGLAQGSDLTRVRDEIREQHLAHGDAESLHARQHQSRSFRHWRDRFGMVRFAGSLPPEVGLPIVRRIEAAANRTRRATRRKRGASSPLEGWEAYSADGFVEVSSGDGSKGRPSRTDLVLVCDASAFMRGHQHPGEVCHMIGGGPLPVRVVREMAKGAFIKAALLDGTNIHTVKHFGRHIPAELRTALDLGAAPRFTGRQCVDCGSRWNLEYDHRDPVANHGPTSFANLEARCWTDHEAKTERDRLAGRLGPHPPRRRRRSNQTTGEKPP